VNVEMTEPSREPRTLVEVARLRAATEPSRIAYSFVGESLAVIESTTFGDLDMAARAIAAEIMRATNGEVGARAMLVLRPSLDYVRAFLGCLYAGVVAVPTYPPTGRNADVMRRIAADCSASILLTTRELATVVGPKDLLPEGVVSVVVDDVALDGADGWVGPGPGPDDLAFLQYTSGSTGMPKGVMVTHGNLMDNEALIGAAYGLDRDDVWFTWLPMYHDMGLIGTILHPLYSGATAFVSSPMQFVQKPSHWLEAISHFRATVSGGPNFAYQLAVERLREDELAKIDLSTWRVAFNGAEPINAATLDAFARRFAACGFRPESIRTSYGLAEATVFVACSATGHPPTLSSFDRTALEAGVAEGASDAPVDGARDSVRIAGYRLGATSADVVVVDPTTRVRAREGHVAEIWTTGSSVARGYWNKPELSEATFRAAIEGDTSGARYLRTGDLGFVWDGELFVTGRLKDVMIVHGRNYYPQDAENAAESAEPGLRAGCTVAFARGSASGDAEIVIVAEVDRARLRDLDADAIVRTVRRAVAETTGLFVGDVALVKPGTVPKTSSGKLRRRECKELWSRGDLARLNPRDVGSADSAPVSFGETERNVASAFAKILGRAPTSADATVYDYGADSIKIVQLARELGEMTGRTVSVGDLYEASSVRGIAALLDRGVVDAPAIDLYAEARLPDDVRPAPTAHAVESARHVLVTGATGFLGAYLVGELLSIPEVQVSCLVRANDDTDARARVVSNLLAYGLLHGDDASRVHAVAGSLEKPRLGLGAARYDALVDEIDAVYHSAAAVDWALPYHRLKASNVDATVEVLRFACSGKAKPVHHVSTMWVFPIGKSGDPNHPIDRETHLPRADGLETGYNRSKWVAERLVAEARDRGLPVTIHRMDFITAATNTGAFKMTDLVPRLVRDAVNLGTLPSDDVRLDLVAVDTLAKMIVLLSRSPRAVGKIFHLLNHERLSLSSLARMLGEAGYAIERVPYADWKSCVVTDASNALFPLCPLLDSYDSDDLALSLAQGADSSQAVTHLEELEPGLVRSNPSMETVVRELLVELRSQNLIGAPEMER